MQVQQDHDRDADGATAHGVTRERRRLGQFSFIRHKPVFQLCEHYC